MNKTGCIQCGHAPQASCPLGTARIGRSLLRPTLAQACRAPTSLRSARAQNRPNTSHPGRPEENQDIYRTKIYTVRGSHRPPAASPVHTPEFRSSRPRQTALCRSMTCTRPPSLRSEAAARSAGGPSCWPRWQPTAPPSSRSALPTATARLSRQRDALQRIRPRRTHSCGRRWRRPADLDLGPISRLCSPRHSPTAIATTVRQRWKGGDWVNAFQYLRPLSPSVSLHNFRLLVTCRLSVL